VSDANNFLLISGTVQKLQEC